MINQITADIKALIFDLDGTLIDSMPAHYEAWRIVLSHHGFHLSKEALYKIAGIPSYHVAQILLKQFNADLPVDALVTEKEKLYLAQIDKVKVIKPTFEIVKKYYKKLPMAVGTGGYREISLLLLEKTNLLKYFDIVVSADDVKSFKPEPETFLKCAKAMNVHPENCLVFEDADNGVIAANKAGMKVADLRKYI